MISQVEGQKAPDIILASKSPRRHELLSLLDLPFATLPSGFSELGVQATDAADLVRKLARGKAQWVCARLPAAPRTFVIGADTLVVQGGTIFGQPRDSGEAAAMLGQLSGRWHEVVTGLAVCDTGSGTTVCACATTRVKFRSLEDWQIEAYIRTGEPLDKAGAYGIQGKGSLLIDSIEGSFDTVVGLPLVDLSRLFSELGFDIWKEWGERRT